VIERATACLTAAVVTCACGARPQHVGVVFDTGWRFAGVPLTRADEELVEATARRTLATAFSGFAMSFDEDAATDRTVRVEDTPSSGHGPGTITFPGTVGLTLPFSMTSSIRIDALFVAELGVAHCASMTSCSLSPRELLTGLGRGVGATAAHELGHQVGFQFSTDGACDDCYDGATAGTYAHFFGEEHWSDAARAIMRRVLPPAH
jgi:hypothetical protein